MTDRTGFVGLLSLSVYCENCGRTRRLNRLQIRNMAGDNINSVEQLAHKLKCRACDEQGKMSKNISIRPNYKGPEAGSIMAS